MLMLLESHFPPPLFQSSAYMTIQTINMVSSFVSFIFNKTEKRSGLIAAAPQTVSEHRRCRCASPRHQEWASPSPALHRLNSLPLSLAADGRRRQNI